MPRDHQPRAPERVAPPAAGAPLAWLLVAPLLLALAAYARVKPKTSSTARRCSPRLVAWKVKGSSPPAA